MSGGTVLVTGVPGAGKTTLARRLAPNLHLPLLSMDVIKESLFGTLGVRDRDWSFAAAGSLARGDLVVATELPGRGNRRCVA